MVVKTFGSRLSVACGSTTSVVARASAATETIQKTPMMISCLPIDRLLLDTGSILYIPTERDVAARGYPNDRRMLPLRLRPARHRQRSALTGVRSRYGKRHGSCDGNGSNTIGRLKLDKSGGFGQTNASNSFFGGPVMDGDLLALLKAQSKGFLG